MQAWRQGNTGYPMVDASMRELWSTGWLHNRSRVICASFLVKNLLLPWQWGLKHYWDALLDADLECDALGWQYCSGCLAGALQTLPLLSHDELLPSYGNRADQAIGLQTRIPLSTCSTRSWRPGSMTPTATMSADGCPPWHACPSSGYTSASAWLNAFATPFANHPCPMLSACAIWLGCPVPWSKQPMVSVY